MSVAILLKKAEKFEIQPFEHPARKIEDLKKTNVAFSGSPLRHPYDANKVALGIDP